MEIDTAPITRCSRENQKIYQEWFSFADSGLSFFFPSCNLFVMFSNFLTIYLWCFLAISDGDGRLTGPDAIKFFSFSNLPRQDLKQVFNPFY